MKIEKIHIKTVQDEHLFDTLYLVTNRVKVGINFVFGDAFMEVTVETKDFSKWYIVDTYDYEDVKAMARVLDFYLVSATYNRLLVLLVDVIVGDFCRL